MESPARDVGVLGGDGEYAGLALVHERVARCGGGLRGHRESRVCVGVSANTTEQPTGPIPPPPLPLRGGRLGENNFVIAKYGKGAKDMARELTQGWHVISFRGERRGKGGTRRGSQVVPFPWYPALQVHVAGDGVALHAELAEHHAHGSVGTGGDFERTASGEKMLWDLFRDR